MKITIIPSDGAVYENGICYSNLTWYGTPTNIHALQWDTDSGWLEFNDGSMNEDISGLPDWAINAMAAWEQANNPPPPPPPEPPTAEQNKATAVNLLKDTDWATESDVIDPTKSPHLVNQSEFLDYRNQVRQYAVYPIAGYINWPVVPESVWA